MPRSLFTSDMLPAGLSPQQRARQWAEIANQNQYEVTVSIPEPDRFYGKTEVLHVGDTILTRTAATSVTLDRESRHITRDGRDGVLLLMCTSRQPIGGRQLGREVVVPRGAGSLFSYGHPNSTFARKGASVLSVALPRQRLPGSIEDCVARPLHAGNQALQMLRGYVGHLLALEGEPLDATLGSAAAQHMIDLVALAIRAPESGVDPAHRRGVRAARLAAIRDEMRRRSAEPDLTPDVVALLLRISPRYLQQLLYDEGTTFREELTNLRLQRAFALLTDPAEAHRPVADIAFAVGFAEVSTFYRAFRARFGDTPTGVRGGWGSGRP